jgi:hypothetical protein
VLTRARWVDLVGGWMGWSWTDVRVGGWVAWTLGSPAVVAELEESVVESVIESLEVVALVETPR